MTYLRHIPAPPLDRYISHLYYLDGRMPYTRERILPVPLLDLKINLGGAFLLEREAETQAPQRLTESWFVGMQGVYHAVDWPGDMRVYGVRFKPGGAYPFLGLPMSDVYNRVIPLDDLWGRFAVEVRERLCAAPTTEAGLALFEQLMRTRLCDEREEQKIVEYGIAEIRRRRGSLSIRQLCDDISISQNHLGTQFKRVVGTTAKELALLYRFEQVLRAIRPNGPMDWTEIALRYGYYDQSHLNKTFLAFTGHNPTDYLHLRRRVYRDNALVTQLSLRSLPVDLPID